VAGQPHDPGKRTARGVPRAADHRLAGRGPVRKRNLEGGDGYCMTNNSRERSNRGHIPITRSSGRKEATSLTYYRQAIKCVCRKTGCRTPCRNNTGQAYHLWLLRKWLLRKWLMRNRASSGIGAAIAGRLRATGW
jgi:hypothetical protein